jgi:hypothetical protein
VAASTSSAAPAASANSWTSGRAPVNAQFLNPAERSDPRQPLKRAVGVGDQQKGAKQRTARKLGGVRHVGASWARERADAAEHRHD